MKNLFLTAAMLLAAGSSVQAAPAAKPTVSVRAIQHDAELYPAHPKAPDFTKVKAADFGMTLN